MEERAGMDDLRTRALATVAGCDDPEKLRRIASNARNQGDAKVERAASLRLYQVQPSAEPGTLEHDVWRSVYALEDTLKRERGRTTPLMRTRQKIARDGEAGTVADLVAGAPSDGFRMLVDRNMVDHTFEAVALRHPDRFADDLLDAAAARLKEAGFDPSAHRVGTPDAAQGRSQELGRGPAGHGG